MYEMHQLKYGIESWRNLVNKNEIWDIPYVRETYPEDEDDGEVGYNLAEDTSDESDIDPGELSVIRTSLDSISKYSFEYLIKKEKKARKQTNEQKGYKRVWMLEYKLV